LDERRSSPLVLNSTKPETVEGERMTKRRKHGDENVTADDVVFYNNLKMYVLNETFSIRLLHCLVFFEEDFM